VSESGTGWQIHHGDCLDVLAWLGRDGIDAVLTDPPYGMSWDTDSTRFTGGQRDINRGDGRDDWGGVSGDDAPFDPAPWIDFPRVVLFGSNHYAQRLPVGTTLVWLKKEDHHFGTFLSDAEVAWMKGGYGVYCFRKKFPPPSRMAEAGGECAYPCQKPVSLGVWCLKRMGVEPGMTVLDPYAGSGSFGESCLEYGARYIGIERVADTVAVAVDRLKRASAQGRLFA
jgi:site-specific DNA-methyltransferase (adenine-specific)